MYFGDLVHGREQVPAGQRTRVHDHAVEDVQLEVTEHFLDDAGKPLRASPSPRSRLEELDLLQLVDRAETCVTAPGCRASRLVLVVQCCPLDWSCGVVKQNAVTSTGTG